MKVHKFTEILTYFNTAFNEIENFLPTTGLLYAAMSAFVKVRAAVRHTSTESLVCRTMHRSRHSRMLDA